MLHFVVKPVCPLMDIKDICARTFEQGSKYLVIMERHPAPHWHCQGTPVGGFKREKFIANLNKMHSMKRVAPRCRPCGTRTKTADNVGFQYMLKQSDHLIVEANHFTEEELDELEELAINYRAKYKAQMPDYVKKNLKKRDRSPEELHCAWRSLALAFYKEEGRRPPPRNQSDILWAMAQEENGETEVHRYVSARI